MFQQIMDTILQGIPGVLCYVDDILVTGSTDEEHLERLEVFRRLQDHDIRLKTSKCFFMKDSVAYLGHLIDAKGIRALPEKIAAIVKTPLPRNVHQLRSFLGLVGYYRKFLPNLTTVLQPLNELLQKNHKWVWSNECSRAVEKVEWLLTTTDVLTHYDPKLPLRLAADAS